MSDIKLQQIEVVGQGFFQLKRYHLQYRRFDGAWSALINREVFVPPYPAVGILLYDPKAQKIALVEQFRLGVLADEQRNASTPPWVVEIVMGMYDKRTETYQNAAVREAQEEAGIVVNRVVPMSSFYNSPGISSEYTQLYCGEFDSQTINGEVHGLAEEHEDIKLRLFSVSDLPALLAENYFIHATTILALQWFLLNKEQLWN